MPWARMDDNVNSDAKLLALSDSAYRMWVAGNVYCQKNMTEGFIPDFAIHSFGVRRPNKRPLIVELCAVLVHGKKSLWHRVEGGYQMNDYLDWNDPREVIERKRDKAKKRLQRFRDRMRNGTGAQASAEKRVSERVVKHGPERSLFAVPVPQEQIQERTARLTPRPVQKPVENSERPKTTPWRRLVAICHTVMDAFPESHAWASEVKARCLAQGVDYGELRDGRPVYARAIDFVEEQRKRRKVAS